MSNKQPSLPSELVGQTITAFAIDLWKPSEKAKESYALFMKAGLLDEEFKDYVYTSLLITLDSGVCLSLGIASCEIQTTPVQELDLLPVKELDCFLGASLIDIVQEDGVDVFVIVSGQRYIVNLGGHEGTSVYTGKLADEQDEEFVYTSLLSGRSGWLSSFLGNPVDSAT